VPVNSRLKHLTPCAPPMSYLDMAPISIVFPNERASVVRRPTTEKKSIVQRAP
jgi:hypothetical protein